ncbi:MAG: hypothetical protein NWT08_14065 [Akkermansiaceae bacterium]|jgi:hypothetical protein|nr:hypothetical protein [Akkermansiaceae bacterium]MDP4647147.1 hypothetical protein [Akkermansiaceae bacterium]MDP4720458.1 hypothetical protein [Akkermansiaceae bacterium]MDP4780441.1 hypothetical protein [Akkermansiaceae bacterium]MDP4847758.1 hypothetical protein [Akkermansiaceae bacterium]
MHLSDFPDRLSPMLVKELRQGLRTRSFVGVFLALQIILGIILLAASAAADSDDAGSSISSVIFTFFSIAVLIIQPMRGISALSSEVKGNTIDMMVLTRLSAWRIVTGKWTAIVSQSALLLITIVPYLILRYFFGGMNLFGEIMLLAMIFITSATLTAITVGLSASGSVILRMVLPMIALPIAAYSMLMMMAFGGGSAFLIELVSLADKDSRIFVPIYLATCAYGGFFMLSIGTSLIAPYAENHSTKRRLVALWVTIVAAGLGCMSFTDPDVLPFFFVLILLPIFASSLTEFAPLVTPSYRRFAKFGTLGKTTGIFLLPGWPSGLFFCLLLSLIAAVPFLFSDYPYGIGDTQIYGVICLASLLFPAVIINLFRMNGPQRVSNYVLFLLSSGIITLVLAGIAESLSNHEFLWIFLWIPPVLMVLEEMGSSGDAVGICAIVLNLIFIGILLMLAIHTYRKSILEIRASLAQE